MRQKKILERQGKKETRKCRKVDFLEVLKITSMTFNRLKHCVREVLDMLNQLTLSKLFYTVAQKFPIREINCLHMQTPKQMQKKSSHKLQELLRI